MAARLEGAGKGDVEGDTLTPVAERLAVELSLYLFLRLMSVPTGDRRGR